MLYVVVEVVFVATCSLYRNFLSQFLSTCCVDKRARFSDGVIIASFLFFCFFYRW